MIPEIFTKEEKLELWDYGDVCNRFKPDRKLSIKKNRQRYWNILTFTKKIVDEFNLCTFDEGSEIMAYIEEHVAHMMRKEDRSFLDVFYDQYDTFILGEEKSNGELDYYDRELERHYADYNIWKRMPWATDPRLEKHANIINDQVTMKSSKEVMIDAEKRYYGKEMSLSELGDVAWRNLQLITNDSRGVKVLYAI